MADVVEEETEDTRTAPRGEEQPRRCLVCGAEFRSEGAHNHVCKRCKNSQAWRQGY